MEDGQDADPGNSEESNPLDAKGDTQADARVDQPEPPADAESLLRALLVLVREGVEGEGGESSGSDKGGVEEDQAGLGEQAILWRALAGQFGLFRRGGEGATYQR